MEQHCLHLQNSHAVRVGGIRRVCSLAARKGEPKCSAGRRQPVALIGARLQHHLPHRQCGLPCNFLLESRETRRRSMLPRVRSQHSRGGVTNGYL